MKSKGHWPVDFYGSHVYRVICHCSPLHLQCIYFSKRIQCYIGSIRYLFQNISGGKLIGIPIPFVSQRKGYFYLFCAILPQRNIYIFHISIQYNGSCLKRTVIFRPYIPGQHLMCVFRNGHTIPVRPDHFQKKQPQHSTDEWLHPL